MNACDSLICPHRADCLLLTLGHGLGDPMPPAVPEKPKGCPGGLSSRPARPTTAAGIEWLRQAVGI